MPTLFDIPPKHDPKLLFGRERELTDLVKYLHEKRWTVLLGPRRVGKTSLAKCAIEKSGFDSIILDARENTDFANNLFSSLTRQSSSFKLGANVSVPANLPFISVGANFSKQVLKQSLDSLLNERTRRTAILLDEAQWFSDRRTLIMLLAHLYDYHYEAITPIITGSAVGVMKSIIEPNHRSPLFGRPIMQMEVKKWNPSVSMGFLTEGLRQHKLSLDTELMVKTIDTLDGLPGWLTMFGYYLTAKPSDYEQALNKTLGEALKIVDDETANIGKIARGWQSHLKILTNLSSGSKSFSDLLEAASLTNSGLSKHLDMLQRLNYIEKKTDGRYVITDPILAELIKRRIKKP
jgi:AAA+ ATPase superfamily predicted ATPase